MKKILLLIANLLIISILSFAQKQPNYAAADIAIAGGTGFSPALSYSKLWGIGKNGKFKIGAGVRYTGFFAGQTDAITAPAKLTSGETGPQILFKDNVNSNIDTLRLNNIGVHYINIPIYLQYSFNEKLDIGFNIDFIGFSFGGSQSGKYINTKPKKEFNGTTQSGSPTTFNLLLVSDNDLGNLNSELYVRYWVKPNLGIRLGASFQFAEYTTSSKLRLDNDRFRAKSLLPFVAFTFRPFKK
jgi:hypothetical protein